MFCEQEQGGVCNLCCFHSLDPFFHDVGIFTQPQSETISDCHRFEVSAGLAEAWRALRLCILAKSAKHSRTSSGACEALLEQP